MWDERVRNGQAAIEQGRDMLCWVKRKISRPISLAQFALHSKKNKKKKKKLYLMFTLLPSKALLQYNFALCLRYYILLWFANQFLRYETLPTLWMLWWQRMAKEPFKKEPFQKAPDKTPLGPNWLYVYFSLRNMFSFAGNMKVNACSYLQRKLHKSIHVPCSSHLWALSLERGTCVIMYIRFQAAALLPHCLLEAQCTNCICHAFPSCSWISLLTYRLFSAILSLLSIPPGTVMALQNLHARKYKSSCVKKTQWQILQTS